MRKPFLILPIPLEAQRPQLPVEIDDSMFDERSASVGATCAPPRPPTAVTHHTFTIGVRRVLLVETEQVAESPLYVSTG